HSWDGIPGNFQEQLSSTSLIYDDVSAESLARKKKYGAADALKALSSLVEKNPGDGVLARDVGYSAMEWGLSDQAYHLFRRVAKARPFEPQSYRAMAQCLAGMNRNDLAIAYYEMALAGQWDSRFGAFRRIVGLDYLRFLNEIKRGRRKTKLGTYVEARQQNVAKEFGVGEAGMLVTITWNTDNTDVDLHVKEPDGELCFYSNNKTDNGSLTQDVTQGYGPEMYLSKNPERGVFKISAKYYSSNRNRAGTRTKVYATIYRNWGTDKEEVFSKVITLKDGKEMHDVAFIRVN
ncbi:MAG: hypothetical protein P1V97_14955, partial [Planctomycetota bacterium]|nr:hypothetical protein [Planctomycetota bacterium]